MSTQDEGLKTAQVTKFIEARTWQAHDKKTYALPSSVQVPARYPDALEVKVSDSGCWAIFEKEIYPVWPK